MPQAGPGTLLIRDTFMPTQMGEVPHGIYVSKATQETGFQGPTSELLSNLVFGGERPVASSSLVSSFCC